MMFVKDKDILSDKQNDSAIEEEQETEQKPKKPKIKKENMRAAWGDAFDSYLRGITENFIKFRGRATRLEFWGYLAAAGIVWLPLYALSTYIEHPKVSLMPDYSLYFALVTLPPAVAIAARRLHDINKNAVIYLLLAPLLALGLFFVNIWAAVAILVLWTGLLIYLFSKPTDETTGFYGEPKENDEVFGEDNARIINKFRIIGLFFLAMWLTLAGVRFYNLNEQATQMAQVDNLIERVVHQATQSGLNADEQKQAEKLMRKELSKLSGQKVSNEDLNQMILTIVKAAAKK